MRLIGARLLFRRGLEKFPRNVSGHALQRRGTQGGWHVRMGGNGQRHHRLRRPVPCARKVGLSRNDEPGNALARRGLRGRVFARKLGGDEEATERSWSVRLGLELWSEAYPWSVTSSI